MIVTRFAPSPTGHLHLGHAYSAIIGHDVARAEGGRFLLRIEDIDGVRSRPDFIAAILADLAWLGLSWDETPLLQSARLPLYEQALRKLIAGSLAYPCFCSRADIAREAAASMSAPHGTDGPLYPGTCRDLPNDPRRLATQPHSWRLDAHAALAASGALTWYDDPYGPRPVDPNALGDIILKGREHPASYHLACVIDDADSGVTLITRGEDLRASTHPQRILQAALGLPAPVYRHHGLICGADGKRLAKRNAAAGLDAMRASGVDGPALATALREGWLPPGHRWLCG